MNSILASEIKQGSFIICIATNSLPMKMYGVWNNTTKRWFREPPLLPKVAIRIRDRENRTGNYSVSVKQVKTSDTSSIIRGYVSDIEETELDDQPIIIIKGSFLDLDNNKLNTFQLKPDIKVVVI
jgi:uncharacterized lipoprotein